MWENRVLYLNNSFLTSVRDLSVPDTSFEPFGLDDRVLGIRPPGRGKRIFLCFKASISAPGTSKRLREGYRRLSRGREADQYTHRMPTLSMRRAIPFILIICVNGVCLRGRLYQTERKGL